MPRPVRPAGPGPRPASAARRILRALRPLRALLARPLVLAAVAGGTLAPARGATLAPLSHEALWKLPQVGAPAASPDGRWVVVPVTEAAYDEKDEVADLWLVPGDGSAPPRRFTAARGAESSPAWSPDGTRIAFTAKRDGDDAPQVYVIDRDGGEARRLTRVTGGGRSPVWSPDGRWIAFQAAISRGATHLADHQRLVEERAKAKAKVRVYTTFPTRRWDRWLDETQTRLLVVAADGSGEPRDLLAGSPLVAAAGYRGASGEAARDDLQAAWAPDSAALVFTATTQADAEAYDDAVTHLYQVALSGGEPRALTTGDVSHARPVFSPDGRRLACLTSAERGQIYAANRPAVGAWPWTGNLQDPAPGFDRSVMSLAFSPDGSTLFLSGEDAGRIRLWSVPTAGGTPEVIADAGGGVWLAPAVPAHAAKAVIFANWEAAHRPAEVHRIEPGGGSPRPLTRFTGPVVETLDLPPLREFWCTNRAGRVLHSYLALPPGFDPARRYPLLVLIHGGHASMWRDAWSRRWNYHLLARPGYVVLLTDYTGSTGYGEAFTRAIRGDPLRGPADDLNLAADEAIRRHPFIDGSRQAAAGASYGGHLANWLEATTTRYRCLISHAGLASLYSQWATSDSIHHRELMMGGPFWEKSAAWLDQSPATHARDFRTPMLLSIGESDHRVPLNNVLEMWSLLQRQRVPSRLLVWPDENHWIQKGENSRVFYREVHDWLARWWQD